MKRVYCLYRVSTLGQVEKDDIPMQRNNNMTFTSLSLLIKQEIVEEITERLYIGRGYQYKLEWTFGGYIEGRDDDA